MASIDKTIAEVLRKMKLGKPVSSSDYPQDTYLSSGIYSHLEDMSGYTNPKRGFFGFGGGKPKEGTSSGNEYGIQFIYFIDTLYPGNKQRGNTSSVSIGNKISVKPEQKGSEVIFNVIIGEKKIKTKKYDVKEVQHPLFGSAIIFHTHPKAYLREGKSVYGFFSPQDIVSLLRGSTPLSGLVVGKKLWIACKTKDSQMIPPDLLKKATQIEYTDGVDAIIDFVRNELKEYGIVFYFGSLTGKLKKI